jgi:hypothetical protein
VSDEYGPKTINIQDCYREEYEADPDEILSPEEKGQAVFVNHFRDKEFLTKKEVCEQVSIWMNAILLSE